MGRSPCCVKEGLNRGAWTAVEDKMLTDYVTAHGEGGWRNLPKRAGLKRCGKSCRLRWLNYLRPDIKRGNISEDEEELIIRLHKLLGNRWSLIAGRLPGRTDNEIKNYWNTTLCKKVQYNNNNITSNNTVDHNYKYSESAAASPTIKLPKHKQNPTKRVSEPRVIRPKAFRCAAKVCINEQPGIEESQQPLAAATDAFHFEEDDKMPPTLDFLLDFNSIGELCLSDLLDSEFSVQDDMINDNNIHDYVVLLSSPDLMSPEKIMSPESGVNSGHSTSTTHSDFLFFTNFLDSQVADDQFELHEDDQLT